MNTKELVSTVRNTVLEYQTDPIGDDFVVSLLNEAANFAYRHAVKSNDTLFAQEYLVDVAPGQSEYDLPWNAMGKRIEAVFLPSPPNMSQAPWNWFKLKKVDYKQSAVHQTSRVRTYFPSVWSQLNNKFYLFPLPLLAYTARLIISRKFTKMGVYGGRIVNMVGNVLTLDELNDSSINDNKAIPYNAFISITSFKTGEIKALFSYDAVDTSTNEITLVNPPAGRTTYMGYPISAAPAGDFGDIELDDYVTYGYTNGRPILSEEFDYFLINWAVNRIRGVLNENDNEAMNALKMEIQQLAGDLAGRETGMRKERTSYMQAAGTAGFPGRRR